MSAESSPPISDRNAILEDLKAALVEVADGKLEGVEIDPSGHLLDHGYVDSLSAVLFLSHVAERYGAEIDDVELLEQYSTLDLLVDRLLDAGA